MVCQEVSEPRLVSVMPSAASVALIPNGAAEARGGLGWVRGVGSGRGQSPPGPATSSVRLGRWLMAGTSEECQSLEHLDAQLKVVSGEVL